VERRKMEVMNQLWLQYIYTCKCHNGTPCIAILNKNVFFSKNKDRKVKQVLSGSWFQWEGGVYKEKVKEGEYGRNTYSCMKMEKRELLKLF
jgi:hypothetical protein